ELGRGNPLAAKSPARSIFTPILDPWNHNGPASRQRSAPRGHISASKVSTAQARGMPDGAAAAIPFASPTQYTVSMHCPFCQHGGTPVIDSRLADDGATVRRRRECPECGERFNTFETAELKLPTIIKSGERRQMFDEQKLRVSFERALQKRPVSGDAVDAAVRAVI